MNPEDRIRMLMEENARLRAQLAQGSPYAGEPLLDDAQLAGMEEEYNRRVEGPSPYMQTMPFKGEAGGKPYFKKMPKKGPSGNSSQYIRKL